LFALDPLADFLPIDADVFWRRNAQSNLVPFDVQDGTPDITADHQCFSDASGEYEHGLSPG
jgi:hypothetical protein